jgi:hypothetical protein
VSQWTRIQTEDETPDHPNPQKGIWTPFVKDLYRLARLSADNADMLVEVLGTLSNISKSELPKTLTFTELIKDNGRLPLPIARVLFRLIVCSLTCARVADMLQLCQRLLVPGIAEDDIVLQVVMLLSVWQADPDTLPLFQSFPRLPTLLVDVLGDKCEDAELVLQSAVALEGFIVNEAFVSDIVYDTQAVARFCDMMTHACPDVRSIAQHCLDVAIVSVLRQRVTRFHRVVSCLVGLCARDRISIGMLESVVCGAKCNNAGFSCTTVSTWRI